MSLIAATVLTGAHYVVDAIAAGAVFVTSVCPWRRFVTRLRASENRCGYTQKPSARRLSVGRAALKGVRSIVCAEHVCIH
jgi:hypothetical protein